MVKQDRGEGLTISATTKRAAIGLMVMTATACQQGSVAPSVSPTTSPSPKPSVLAACPAAAASPGPQVLLQKQPAPDDLAFDNTGRLLFSDIKTGAVSILNPDGSVQQVAGGMSAPEGIAVQADGRILVAEQGRNRVVAIDPQSHAVTPWHAFPNRTGRDGLDGIGPILPSKDAQGNLLPTADHVIVPDSPNGVVWRVTPDGKTATQIASGMVRPVGAAVDSSGRIFVADEGGALWVLDPARHRFATLSTPDDVLVGRAGHIFANTLGDNAIHELDQQGHQVGVITGIQQPQGIALDGADNLYYTEFNTGRIDRVIRTFSLDTPTVTRTTRGTYIICPVIRRAAGFSQPLGLATGSSLTTNILQIVQPGTDSSGALEVQTPEHRITIGVDTTSGGVNLGLSQTVQLSP
jgi:sugar lactone lactonase YvrE